MSVQESILSIRNNSADNVLRIVIEPAGTEISLNQHDIMTIRVGCNEGEMMVNGFDLSYYDQFSVAIFIEGTSDYKISVQRGCDLEYL